MREISELEKWLDEYYEVFDANYPLGITSQKSDFEIIADIKKCINSGIPAKAQEYKADEAY